MLLILIDIGYHTLLVLNKTLQGNYIAPAIDPFMGRGRAPAHEGIHSKGNIMPYIVPYLIQKGYNIKYSLILIAFLYGLVTPTTVYG